MRHGWPDRERQLSPRWTWGDSLFFLIVATIFASLFLYAMMVLVEKTIPKANAHGWYPPACCSDADCAPLQPGRVQSLNGGGYLVDGTFYIPKDDVKQSLDGRYHGCFPNKSNLRCFFAPPNGS